MEQGGQKVVEWGGQEVASGALITADQLTITFLFFFFFTQCTSVRRLLEKVSKSARQQWEGNNSV